MPQVSRRTFALGSVTVAASGLSGCVGSGRSSPFAGGGFFSGPAIGRNVLEGKPTRLARADYDNIYGPMDGERYAVQAFAYETLDPAFLRQDVAYTGLETPGTIVVDPNARFLYRRKRTASHALRRRSWSRGFWMVG